MIAGLRIETPLHCAALQALVAIQSRIPQGVPPKQDPLPVGVQALCRKLETNFAALLKDLCWQAGRCRGFWGGIQGWS